MTSVIAQDVLARIAALGGGTRRFIAVTGPPGSGKSTYADALCAALIAQGSRAAVLPMDGYHYDNAILDQRGWRDRKGAPHTFDVAALEQDLQRLRQADRSLFVPVFDRAQDLSRAFAREIPPDCDFIVVEGNYLLLDVAPWHALRGLFDLTLFCAVADAVVIERLMVRWRSYGLSEAEATKKVFENDLLNAALIDHHSVPADLTIET